MKTSVRNLIALTIVLIMPFQGCGTLGGNPINNDGDDGSKNPWLLDFGGTEDNPGVSQLTMCLGRVSILDPDSDTPIELETIDAGKIPITYPRSEAIDIGSYNFPLGSYTKFGLVLTSNCAGTDKLISFINNHGPLSTDTSITLQFKSSVAIHINGSATDPIQFNFTPFLTAIGFINGDDGGGDPIPKALEPILGEVSQ